MSFIFGMIAKVTWTLNFSIIPETSNITIHLLIHIRLLFTHMTIIMQTDKQGHTKAHLA